MYVIKRLEMDGGKYVAKPGMDESYTFHIEKVVKFATKEEAENARCVENEVVVPLSDI